MGSFSWPGRRKTAVTLSYDDGLSVHRHLVAPALSQRGLTGTFFVPVQSSDLQDHVDDWRSVATAGHELGNHSVFHPCRGEGDMREWLTTEYDLRNYSPRRWRDEMAMANFVLHLIDGRDRRTFGNTCSDTEIGGGHRRSSIEPLIAELFIAARGAVSERAVDPADANLQALGCYEGDHKAFADYRAEIESQSGGWLLYMIHGVGEGTHRLFVDDRDHVQLLDYLADNARTVWTAPLAEVASYIECHTPKPED